MKTLHRSDLLGWSRFDEARNLDFHSVLWARSGGSLAIDPLPLSPHDEKHLRSLGPVGYIIVTNSDHVRAAAQLKQLTGATLFGPRAERETFPIACDAWLGEDDEPAHGMRVLEMSGSKTPGELALLLDGTTLVTGDLVRGHVGGRLNLLPDAKLSDRASAVASVQRLATLVDVDAVLVGDGWPVFRDGRRALQELADRLTE